MVLVMEFTGGVTMHPAATTLPTPLNVVLTKEFPYDDQLRAVEISHLLADHAYRV